MPTPAAGAAQALLRHLVHGHPYHETRIEQFESQSEEIGDEHSDEVPVNNQ
jgi:hypothetical protein